ncbi:MAG: alpha/beta hydrolase [Clostridiales bacterium]|jgi:hypothetical protein|nr:alpha/beta hydrolase [Clostridiales bacterium]
MTFGKNNYVIKTYEANGAKLTARAFLGAVYVDKPLDAEFQKMNIFVPEIYYSGGEVNGYSLRKAPVFMPTLAGGYMPAVTAEPGPSFYNPSEANALFRALERGYVAACPALRGRTRRFGKAPACIVDYKAAVRFLRRFDGDIPGDKERIITSGTSAGGALSALMGASGNSKDYAAYLDETGAADERDDIFAANCYCPITNLENADAAYEWQFSGVYGFHRMHMRLNEGGRPSFTPEDGTMTDKQALVSRDLEKLFPQYLNSLGLKDEKGASLTLDADGDGSFKRYIEGLIAVSAGAEADSNRDFVRPCWLTGGNAVNFAEYAKNVTRMKTAPAFDGLSLESPENNLFGTDELTGRHFTPYAYENSAVNGDLAGAFTVGLMNPMGYISKSACAAHWRIRHGEADRDTSIAVSAMLALKLKNHGCAVDYHLPWNIPHSGDYDLEELFAWIDGLCGGRGDD